MKTKREVENTCWSARKQGVGRTKARPPAAAAAGAPTAIETKLHHQTINSTAKRMQRTMQWMDQPRDAKQNNTND